MAQHIFNVKPGSFLSEATGVYRFQLANNPIYSQYVQNMRQPQKEVDGIEHFPFLPVGVFKTQLVRSFPGSPDIIFSSSSTTGLAQSLHAVKDVKIYEQSFIHGFQHFYGSPDQFAFLCLLPSYLERSGSSLVYMAEKLIGLSGNADSGFFLESKGRLTDTLAKRENLGQKTILLGVTYALLDFAINLIMPLRHTIVMETGGMKGRKKELTRAEVHAQLKQSFHQEAIHSEYGMTELMSQAYAKADGRYHCPPWMRVLVREEDDPLMVKLSGTGVLCIIDLANLYSCSFIETADVGKVYDDGSFEVLGRLDNSDIRGCSLLAL